MIVAWIALRVMREILRDRRTVVFFFLVPLAVMALVYLALVKDDVARVGIVYRGLAQNLAGPVEASLWQAEGVRRVALPDLDTPTAGHSSGSVPDEPDPEGKILAALRRGEADAVLLLSEGLVQERLSGHPGTVVLYVEGSRPQLTAQVRQAVFQAAAHIAPAIEALQVSAADGTATGGTVSGGTAAGGTVPGGKVPGGTVPPGNLPACPAACASAGPPGVRLAYLHGAAGYRLVDFFLPTLLPFFVFFFTFMVATITFQRERSRGTLERILIAPVGLVQVVLGYVLGFAAFCLAQVAIVLAFILALITYPIGAGQGAELVALSVIVMLIALIIGLLVSYNAGNEFQAVQFVPLVILPQIFLSDLIWTLDGFPAPLRWVAQILPLTHANAITRNVLLKGMTLGENWAHLLALAAIFLAALALLAWEGRRKGGAAP